MIFETYQPMIQERNGKETLGNWGPGGNFFQQKHTTFFKDKEKWNNKKLLHLQINDPQMKEIIHWKGVLSKIIL